MKKVISVILAVMMIFSAMTAMVSAIEVEEAPITGTCTCASHVTSPANSCKCCVLCPNLDKSVLTACAKNTSTDGSFDGSVCCYNCTGIWPCDCGCTCCTEHDQNIDDTNGTPIIPEDTQEEIVDGFQKILQRFVEWFDKLFDAIFEFLRFDEIMGN